MGSKTKDSLNTEVWYVKISKLYQEYQVCYKVHDRTWILWYLLIKFQYIFFAESPKGRQSSPTHLNGTQEPQLIKSACE